jgi:ring-1,2-phenylacetyl-CoA epoxidase subunit PaaD
VVTYEDIWRALEEVKDPEIPVVSLVEMGMVRGVALDAVHGRAIVTMTPTFLGCPALYTMKAEIKERLLRLGVAAVEVRESLSPAWSTDWISEEGRRKLKDFGLSPPPKHGGDEQVLLADTARCPYCDSENTALKNTFGPTLCRAIYVCNDCRQPFEQFKPV